VSFIGLFYANALLIMSYSCS